MISNLTKHFLDWTRCQAVIVNPRGYARGESKAAKGFLELMGKDIFAKLNSNFN